VRISNDALGADPQPMTEWSDRAGDLWVDRTGDWIVWQEPNVPSDDPKQVVVRNGGRDSRLRLPGYGGRVPTIAPAHDAVIYQRSETARLTVLDLKSGRLLGELDHREFFGGEVSSQAILAAPTAHGPWETNDLCVLEVGSRLASLVDSAGAFQPPPVLTPENKSYRVALLAALRRGGAADFGSLFPGTWSMGTTFRSHDDSTTALNALGTPFALEEALRSLDGEDGTVFVLTGERGDAISWFAVPASALDVPFPRRDFLGDEAVFDVVPGEPPALAVHPGPQPS
jgi:hypothetical protein